MIFNILKAVAVYLIVTFNTIALVVSQSTSRGIKTFDIMMTAISFIVVYLNVRR